MTHPYRVLVCVAAFMTAAASPLSAAPERPQYVVYVDAASPQYVSCIVPDTITGPCPEPKPGPRRRPYLDSLHVVELRVMHRRFFTDYNLEIKEAVTVARPAIRGLIEASKLTLGAGALVTPPTKGAIPSLSSKPASEVFGQLLNESDIDKVSAALEADFQELRRELNQLEVNAAGLQREFARLTTAHAAESCDPNAGDPVLPGVLQCLEAGVALATSGPWSGDGPFGDEKAFDDLLRTANDRLKIVNHFAERLASGRVPALASSLDADLTQLEKNIVTFRSNVAAARVARTMYGVLEGGAPRTRDALRGDQLRQVLRAQLKAAGGEPAPGVDEAELNTLVESYVEFLRRGGYQIAGRQVAALAERFAGWEDNVPALPLPERAQLTRVQRRLLTDVVDRLGEINERHGRLINRINFLYDHSRIDIPLTKPIKITRAADENTFGYNVRWTEGFQRQVVPDVTLVSAGAIAVAPAALPPAAPAAPAPAPGAGGPQPAPAPGPPPPSRQPDPFIHGSFDYHDFDRATVVGGFVFSTLRSTNYGTQAQNGSTIAIETSSQRGQQHVLLGLEYYFRPRDTHPNAVIGPRDTLGILGGLSVTALNHYFIGLSWEPKLGFNFAGGAHLGTETAVQNPYAVGKPLDGTTVPTYERRTIGVFFMAGLDIDIFRKVFGKPTGVGTASSSSSRAPAGR